MYIDIKETVWTRYEINDKSEEEILKALNNGLLPWEFSDNFDSETLLDTAEFIRPEENDGESTIEFFKDGNVIWSNEKK